LTFLIALLLFFFDFLQDFFITVIIRIADEIAYTITLLDTDNCGKATRVKCQYFGFTPLLLSVIVGCLKSGEFLPIAKT